MNLLFIIAEEKGVEDLDTQDWQKNLFLLTMSTKFVVHTLWSLNIESLDLMT